MRTSKLPGDHCGDSVLSVKIGIQYVYVYVYVYVNHENKFAWYGLVDT